MECGSRIQKSYEKGEEKNKSFTRAFFAMAVTPRSEGMKDALASAKWIMKAWKNTEIAVLNDVQTFKDSLNLKKEWNVFKLDPAPKDIIGVKYWDEVPVAYDPVQWINASKSFSLIKQAPKDEKNPQANLWDTHIKTDIITPLSPTIWEPKEGKISIIGWKLKTDKAYTVTINFKAVEWKTAATPETQSLEVWSTEVALTNKTNTPETITITDEFGIKQTYSVPEAQKEEKRK